MKIGIFGDSYAFYRAHPGPVWSELLPSKYDVTNHGVIGSSLFYSIEQIKLNRARYDKIILIATSPGRIQFSDIVETKFPFERFVSVKAAIEYQKDTELKKHIPNKIFLKALDAAYDYFVYIQNNNFDQYVHSLMLKDIKDIIPDIILINGFNISQGVDDKNNMSAIFEKENKHWGIDTITSPFIDKRNCHMTDENNVIFARKVEEWLNGAPVFIDPDEFVTPDNKEFYLKTQ